MLKTPPQRWRALCIQLPCLCAAVERRRDKEGRRVQRAAVLASAVALSVACTILPAEAQDTFAARLEWVPIGGTERGNVAGEGAANARLSASRLSINGSFTGLPAKATAAKLYEGTAKGARGLEPVVVAELRVSDDTSGRVSGNVRLSEEQIGALRAGRLYVQIFSEKGTLPDHATLWGWLASERARR